MIRRGLITLIAVALLLAAGLGVRSTLESRLTPGLEVAVRGTATIGVPLGRGVTSATCLAAPAAIRANLGLVATLDPTRGTLMSLAAGTCIQRTLLRAGAESPVEVSPDGHWIAEGNARVLAADGQQLQSPLGDDIWNDPGRSTWSWSPDGHTLAGITNQGGIVAGAPDLRPRTLEPNGWGATSLVFAGDTSVLAIRGQGQLWSISVPTGRSRLVYRDPVSAAVLQLALAANGSALVWSQPYQSASTAADGDALERIGLADGRAYSLHVGSLLAPGFVQACGSGVTVVAGYGRESTLNKTVLFFDRGWRAQRIGSGVSPSCSADGHSIAYAAGPPVPSEVMGTERRRILLLRHGNPVRVISAAVMDGPGADRPVLSPDGRAVLWIQAVAPSRASEPSTPEGTVEAALTGPDLHRTGPLLSAGRATDYYGTFSWPLDVSTPAAP